MSSQQIPKYMRAKQLAKHLGIAIPTVWLYLKQGRIKSKKLSKAVTVFEVAEVEKDLFKDLK